jgi:hypothetical protein
MMSLSLSCYKLAYHCFPTMVTSSRHVGPGHLPAVWCYVLLFRLFGPVISYVLRIDVINTGYTVYSQFVALCVKLILAHIKVGIQFWL